MAEDRFSRLEIGILPGAAKAPAPPPAPPPAAAAAAPSPAPGGLDSCPRCGALSRAGASDCWACLKPLAAPSAPAASPLAVSPAAPAPGAAADDIVLRLDGRVYRSGDPDLPPGARRIMERVRAQGLTPELLDEFRRSIPEVRYRPATSYYPSDGDRDFWRGAGYGGYGYGGYGWRRGYPTSPWAMPLVLAAIVGVLAFALWAFKSFVMDAAVKLGTP